MLDIKLIREKPDFVRQRMATRGGDNDSKLTELFAIDEQRRKALAEVEQLKASRNRVSKEIGALMAQKKADEAEARKIEVRQMGERIAELDRQVAQLEERRDTLMLQLPNLPHEKVKIGQSAADNPEMRTWGEKARFDFKPKTHVELCESLKLVDFARRPSSRAADFFFTPAGARGWSGL
jgi:seryl-tRNA synthetase